MRAALLGSTLAFATSAFAAIAQTFQPAATSPESSSGNYTGQSNGTISNGPLVPGKVFDRFIQIWLENTDFATAASSVVFQNLTKQGLLLDAFYAVTHPSEPNYIASVGGDIFGADSDNFSQIPQNISSVADLLEEKNVSWASYQENMPYDAYTGFNYTQKNYLTGNGTYTYYVRKHNPLIIYNSVANVSSRALRIRNFNDFAGDLKANAIPQWSFITPNLVDDAHDTTIDFASAWLTFWLIPLLNDANFNNNRTLIFLTFDENETYTINNRIYTLVLGNGLPANLRGTTDSTFYTHYTALSTVQANWGLKSLGRGDTNATLNNVLDFVASQTNWTNNGISGNSTSIPLLNITGTIPGPLNVEYYVPFTAPNTSGVGAGGGGVFVSPLLNTSFTADKAPAPVNLTASGRQDPWLTDPGFNYANGTEVIVSATASGTAPASSGKNAAVALRMGAGAGAREAVVCVLGVVVGVVMLL